MIGEDEIFGPEAAAPVPRRLEQEEDTTMEDTPEKREVVKRRQRKSEVELAIDPEDQDRREENIPENDDGAYQRRKEVMVEVECMRNDVYLKEKVQAMTADQHWDWKGGTRIK